MLLSKFFFNYSSLNIGKKNAQFIFYIILLITKCLSTQKVLKVSNKLHLKLS